MSLNEIRREKAKAVIEAMYLLLRRNRKSFLKAEKNEEAFELSKLSHFQFEWFKQLITVSNYYKFQLQVSDVLVEGIKYPDITLRELCKEVFLQTQNWEINPYLWKKLLAADYIPEVAQDFIKNNRNIYIVMVYNIVCSKNNTAKFLEQALILIIAFFINKLNGGPLP